MHSLYPAESAVLYISGADCDGCLYIPGGGSAMTMGTPYYVRVTAYNALGGSSAGFGSDNSGVSTVIPNQASYQKIYALLEKLDVYCLVYPHAPSVHFMTDQSLKSHSLDFLESSYHKETGYCELKKTNATSLSNELLSVEYSR